MLGLALRGAARSVVTRSVVTQRQHFDAMVGALRQNFCPVQQVEIRLHIIHGQPKSLQEAGAYVLEVDVVMEASKPKAPSRRAQVQ